jgi:ketosteroid isomerase-like protein
VIVERQHGAQSAEVFDRVLDKGIVIDAWLRVSLAGIDLLQVDARVVVASIETYLKYTDGSAAAEPTHAVAPPAVPTSLRTAPPRRTARGTSAAHTGPGRIAQAAVRAWNGRDASGYGALLGDDYVGETHAVPVTLYGRGAARRAMRMKFAMFPDLKFDVHDVVTAGDEALVSWVATATTRGHERVRVSGCTVGRMRDGKIGHTWCYWDAKEMVAPLRVASDGSHTLHCVTTPS